jgi:hypothetical protein
MARVLRPGGWHIGTCPFTNVEASILKSILVDGKVVHLMPPEYHGDPVTGGFNSLVFEIPGWNILERAKKAGLSKAYIRMVASMKYAASTRTTASPCSVLRNETRRFVVKSLRRTGARR